MSRSLRVTGAELTCDPGRAGFAVNRIRGRHYFLRDADGRHTVVTETMPSPEKRTFSLPTEQAGYIDALVASGSYASGSEVVRAGLRALQERDATVETWLRKEVIGVYDAMQSDPVRAIPADLVFAAIRSRHADQVKKKRREPQG